MKTSYRERDHEYGEAMLKLRTAIGLTQRRLGNLVGVSWRAVAEWEAGSSYPKAERLKAESIILTHEGDTNMGTHRLREKAVKDATFEGL
jgi:transcriptional regulator with XRE-family HTH domain